MAKPNDASWGAQDEIWPLRRLDGQMTETERKPRRVRAMDKRVQTSLGRQIAAVFDDTARADLPEEICELLSRLDRD
jgi:hypothetical protein